MPLKVGSKNIVGAYVGAKRIVRGYVGSTLVFDSAGEGEPGGTSFVHSARLTAANITSITFEDVAIGSADAGRVVAVGITASYSSGGTGIPTAVSIGGISATRAVQQSRVDYRNSTIWYAVVPTGTTADVAITRTAPSGSGVVADIWYGYPAFSAPFVTAGATGGDNLTFNSQSGWEGGALLMCGSASGGWTTQSWSGADTLSLSNGGGDFGGLVAFSEEDAGDLLLEPSGSSSVAVAALWDNRPVAHAFMEARASTPSTAESTYAGMQFGFAAADRVLIAVVVSDNQPGKTHALSSVSIGGVTATIVVNSNPAGGDRWVAIAIAEVPTGNTGDVVVTNDTSGNRQSVHLYRAQGLSSLTPHDTGVGNFSTNLDVPAGGFIIGGQDRHTTGTVTWTGLTKRSHVTPGGQREQTSASGNFETTQTATVSVNNTGFQRIAAASWS